MITKQLKTDLSSISFFNLKDQLTNIFISKYSPDGIIIANNHHRPNRARNRHNRNNINPGLRRPNLPNLPQSRWGPAIPGAVPIDL